MNEETEGLITFSEAARLRRRTPQSIDDLVKRKRLNVKVISGKKFVYKKEVENLEIGKSGRPSKLKVQESKLKFEELVRKNKHPENYYPSLLSEMLKMRHILKESKRENPNQPIQDFLADFSNENFKRNRQKFRQTFRHCERKLQTRVFLNQRIIVERIYSDSKIQAFFDFVLLSPDIKTNSFSIENLFVRFMSEFFNEFGFIVDKLKADSDFKKSLKRVGRKKTIMDEKGNIKGGATLETRKAIKYLNEGKTGKEIGELLFNNLKPNLRKQKMKRVARNLEYQYKKDQKEKNPMLFKHPFDISIFKKTI